MSTTEQRRIARHKKRDELQAEEDQLLELELSDLYHPGSKYTPEEKVRAVMIYVMHGTIKKSAKVAGIPQQTMSHWKNKAVWWEDTVRECRKKKQNELDAMYTGLIHDIIGQVQDRVTNGDSKMDRNGVIQKIPMGGKDLSIVMAVTFDKRQLLRGEATSRVEKVSEKDRIDRLAHSFKEMSLKMKKNGFDGKLINGEVIETNE